MLKLTEKNTMVNTIITNEEFVKIMDSFTMVHLGTIKEGELYQDEKGNMIVLKLIAKKDGFDFEDALQEKADADAKAAERAAKKAEKVKKAKAKKEETENEQAE